MATNKIYMDTDNVIEIEDLRDPTGCYINDATGYMSLFTTTIKNLTADASAESANAGSKTKLPCTGHGLVAGDYVRIQGTGNYDGEYAVDSIDGADKFVIVKAYVAETFTGNEEVYTEAITNGTNKTLTAGTGNVWAADKIYPVNAKVQGTDTYTYKCKTKHTSSTQNKPITGAQWDTYWERIDGYYYGTLGDDLVGLADQIYYYLFVVLTKDTTQLVNRMKWQAIYYPDSMTAAITT